MVLVGELQCGGSQIASNAANLLSDIKPGYMLGGKPRHQAMGHVIGLVAGVSTCMAVVGGLVLASVIKPQPQS